MRMKRQIRHAKEIYIVILAIFTVQHDQIKKTYSYIFWAKLTIECHRFYKI